MAAVAMWLVLPASMPVGAANSLSTPATPEPTAAMAPIRAIKIILVGDSTMAVHSGWGGSFCSHHVTFAAACVNLARNGRSTRSYRTEGSWDLALAEMRTAGFADTWVLIQLGHNDQPGKPGRSTDLATEYPANLHRYVAEARAAGAKPVLLTPLTRRMFNGGQLQNDLAPWAAAVTQVAAEEKVPLVDLNALSARAVQAMGASSANALAQVPAPPQVAAAAIIGNSPPRQAPPAEGVPSTASLATASPSTVSAAPTSPATASADAAATPSTSASTNEPAENRAPVVEPLLGTFRAEFDYTHLGPAGADFFATMAADALAREVPALRPYLIL